MEQSELINELAEALSKAQGQITGALKDSSNPFFKSKYADLASCWDACRKQLADNGLSVVQTTEFDEGQVFVVTALLHRSGQWIRGELPVKAKDDGAQAQGSGITYARRYALAAIVGLAQIDDDAEAAQGRKSTEIRGDGPSMIPQAVATDLATRMRGALEADVTEDVKALKVYDIHAKVAHEHDLYIAASDLLGTKERSAWKQYVKIATDKARAEPPLPNGRRAA